MKRLKICEFNVENLFVNMEMYNGEDLTSMKEENWSALTIAQFQNKQKPLFKVKKLAEILHDIDADVIMLSEVGGRESLENFNRYFLNDNYYLGFLEGNSERSIHVAFLIHKDLNYQFEVKTNRQKEIIVEEYNRTLKRKFLRDVLELYLYDGENENPDFIFLTTHLKSQISNDYDPKGKYQRMAEFKSLIGIYSELKEKHQCPIIIGGDFNFNLESSEMDTLAEVGLLEMHEHLETEEEARGTHVHIREDIAELKQLDYILYSKDLEDKVIKDESYNYRFKNYYGDPEEHPQTLKEKRMNPSDHYPLVLTISIDK